MHIQEVTSPTHLGIAFQNNMPWKNHALEIMEKDCKRLNVIYYSKMFQYMFDTATNGIC